MIDEDEKEDLKAERDECRRESRRACIALADEFVPAEHRTGAHLEGLSALTTMAVEHHRWHHDAQDVDYVRRTEQERDNWRETAEQQARNVDFYRVLFESIAARIGVEAFTADDGTVGDSPIMLKVPELVVARLGELDRLRRLRDRVVQAACVHLEDFNPITMDWSGVGLDGAQHFIDEIVSALVEDQTDAGKEK